jgi:hypothetical protein
VAAAADVDHGAFCVLAGGGWELSLVAAPDAIASQIAIADPPGRRAGSPTKLAFEVAAVEQLRAVAAGLGGELDPPESAWTFRGFRNLDCRDPEGNVVQLRQRLPEG